MNSNWVISVADRLSREALPLDFPVLGSRVQAIWLVSIGEHSARLG